MAVSKCPAQTFRLTERVTFQEATEAKNAVHEIISTWADISTNPTVWAEVKPVSGREYFDSRQLRSENTIKVTIRSRSDITEKMRVIHNSITYEIDYTPPYVRTEKYVTLVCHVTV